MLVGGAFLTVRECHPQLAPTKWPLHQQEHWFSFQSSTQHCYLGSPPGDPHVQGIVTANLGVGQTPALLVGFHKGGLLVRQDMANDHGGASNECCLRETGKAIWLHLYPHLSRCLGRHWVLRWTFRTTTDSPTQEARRPKCSSVRETSRTGVPGLHTGASV